MKWNKKIQGGALQFVLFIGAIIAVLLLSFVLVSYSHILFKKKADVTVELIQATDRGFDYSFGKSMSLNDALEIPIESEIGIQTHIKNSYWGLLELRSVTSKKGQLQFTKTGFMGHSNKNRPALYLKENQRPMVIAGDSKITGTAYLPERGIKMGNIQGYGYTKPQLVYGAKKRSTSELPKLAAGVTEQLKKMTDPFFEPQGVEVDFENRTVLKNSFKEQPLIIKGFSIDLEQTQLSGNILVWATNKIVVHNSAQLKDIILIAPHIEIQEGVHGNFQAIAREQIEIGKGSRLDYPTILAVQKQKDLKKEEDRSILPNIFLENGASISGMVLYLDENKPDRPKANIKIDENAMVMGEVYCTQNLELKGTIYGTVMTDAFVAMENGNVYQNHLFNGRMDASLLPTEYGGLCLEKEPANQIMKWLY